MQTEDTNSSMKQKELYIYYLGLIAILVLYTNMHRSPTELFRFGYLAALVLPILKKEALFPAVLICSLGISRNTFAFPIMPTELMVYVYLSFMFAFLALQHPNSHATIHPVFFFALIYVVLIDMVMLSRLSSMALVCLMTIMMYMCLKDTDAGVEILPVSFIIISLAISYWVLFCPEAQINEYNRVENSRQTGWTDPNYLSAALGIGLVIAVRNLFKGVNNSFYLFGLILTVIGSTISMLMLASRGAITAATVSIVSLFVLSNSKRYIKVTVFLLAVLFVIFLYSNQYMDFVISRFETEDGTANNRTLIWISKLHDFFLIENPFNLFFGVGHRMGAELGSVYAFSEKSVSTHNDCISMLLYYGVVGLFLFLYVLFYPVRICQRKERPYILALVIYLFVSSFTIEPLARGKFIHWAFFLYIIMEARRTRKNRNLLQ